MLEQYVPDTEADKAHPTPNYLLRLINSFTGNGLVVVHGTINEEICRLEKMYIKAIKDGQHEEAVQVDVPNNIIILSKHAFKNSETKRAARAAKLIRLIENKQMGALLNMKKRTVDVDFTFTHVTRKG